MLAALLIVFREVLEAGIIVGVVLAASEGIRGRGLWISAGIIGGILGSALLALFASEISNAFEGSGQEVLNAAILGIAMVMLVWTVVWMASHGRQMVAEVKAIGSDVKAGRKPLTALAVVVGMAVLREGAEIVLFVYGIVSAGMETMQDVALGSLVGLLGGVAVSFILYRGLVAIPLKYMFKVTSILIMLVAAGLAAQAVGILQDAGFIQSLSDPVWDTGWLLADDGAIGRVLRTMIGYRAEPTGMQVLAYLATVVTALVLSAFVNRRVEAGKAAARPVSTAR